MELEKLADKLNSLDWNELGFVSGGRFLFSQKSLSNTLLNKNWLK